MYIGRETGRPTHKLNNLIAMAILSVPAKYYRQLIELDFIIEPTGRDDNLINVTVDKDDPMFPELHDLSV